MTAELRKKSKYTCGRNYENVTLKRLRNGKPTLAMH